MWNKSTSRLGTVLVKKTMVSTINNIIQNKIIKT